MNYQKEKYDLGKMVCLWSVKTFVATSYDAREENPQEA